MNNMKYLKTVILENFQSHKYTSIDFDKGLNVILGPSDSGKSAIIRGIKWALYNEPSGDYFIKEGEGQASVTLIFNDNTKIQRIRSKSKNTYILYGKKGEEIKFEGFGLSVPEEIIEATGISKIRLDSDESNAINLGEQLEGPFLLSEKKSTRAGAIGRLIGVNVIDDALKDTLRDVRNKSNTKRITDERLSKIKKELKEYEYLDELEIKLKKVENLHKLISEKSKKQKALILSSNKFNELNKELLLINNQLHKLKDIEVIYPFVLDLEKRINNFKYLKIKKEHYISYQKEIQSATSLINKLDRIDNIDDIIKKSNELYINIKSLSSIKNKFDYIVKEKHVSNNIYNRLVKLPEIEKNLISIEEKPLKISKLIKIRDIYKENQNNLKSGNDFIDRFGGLENSELVYKEMDITANRLIKLLDLSKELESIKTNYSKENLQYNKLKDNIKLQLDKYKDILTKIEICPFCLSNIDNDKMDHIIKHYN